MESWHQYKQVDIASCLLSGSTQMGHEFLIDLAEQLFHG